MSHYLDNMITSNKQKNYMFDVEDYDFLKEHIKKDNNVLNTHYEFDDETILFLVKNGFDNTLNLLKNNNSHIEVTYYYNNEIKVLGKISRANLMKQILEVYNSGKLNNIPNADSFIDEIKELSTPNISNLSEDYVATIDNEKFTLKSKELLDFITFGFKECNLKTSKKINGIDKAKYFYILKNFIINYQINEKYIMNADSLKFIEDINNDTYANTYPLNKYLNTIDNNLIDTYLNQDLIDEVYKDMPKNYTKLQKSIYTYIKLCKVLTYDSEFYANSQKGFIARMHQNIERLASISSKNPKIVCYEFNQIFAKMLDNLDINYEVSERYADYGESHTNLTFRVDDYIIFADSVTSILGGDLFNAKINNELVGLECKNKNKQTLKDYNKQYFKVYDDIIENEEIKKSDEALFEEFLDMFDTLCEKENVGLIKKISVFEKQSKNIDLPDMEKITYLMRLSKAVFESELKNKQFEVTIVSKKTFEGYQIKNTPALIFSFNDISFKENSNGTYYKVLNEKNQLVNINKQELEKGFSSRLLKHITAGVKDAHSIPGLNLGEVNNVR